MIVALGADIIEVSRVKGVWERAGWRFLHRVFTPAELVYCLTKADPAPSLAVRFAAKEAFQKCFPSMHAWKDVSVQFDGPKPILCYSPRLAEEMKTRRWRAHVSLSHSRGNALAVVVLETDQENP